MPPSTYFKTLLRQIKNKRFVDFIEEYIAKTAFSKNYKARLRTTINIIKEFEKYTGKKIYTHSFTLFTSEKFVQFLIQKDLRNNTIRTCLLHTSSLLNKARKENYPVQNELPHLIPPKEITTQVFLDMKELQQLYQTHFEGQKAIIRDAFLLDCFLGLRKTDLQKLTPHNILGNNFVFKKTEKTKENVVIPLHPLARQILVKYHYKIPDLKTIQNFNKQIKIICKEAGITTSILCEYFRGNKLIQELCPKYKLISYHTARRTLITNLYLDRIPLPTIMKISGHKNITSVILYIRMSDPMHRQALKNSVYLNPDTNTQISNPTSLQLDYRKNRKKSRNYHYYLNKLRTKKTA